jgi:hypothetical protein
MLFQLLMKIIFIDPEKLFITPHSNAKLHIDFINQIGDQHAQRMGLPT